IIGTIIVYQQIQYAKNRPIGYDKNSLLTIPSSEEIHKHFDAVRTELVNKGLITEMAEAGGSPAQGAGSSSGFSWPGKDPNLSIDFPFTTVSNEYGKTIGWEMKQG